MKKLFYILCMSALIFTGCKKSSPTADNSAEIIHNFCTDHPENELCQDMEGKSEMTVQDVKPVMKLEEKSTDMLYGASDPSAWLEGYSNLQIITGKSYASATVSYTHNFSVEPGSVLTVDMEFHYWSLNAASGKVMGSSTNPKVATIKGGDAFGGYTTNYKGVTVARVAVFDDLGKYLYLPPLRFAP